MEEKQDVERKEPLWVAKTRLRQDWTPYCSEIRLGADT
jgi:hypothetical protein